MVIFSYFQSLQVKFSYFQSLLQFMLWWILPQWLRPPECCPSNYHSPLPPQNSCTGVKNMVKVRTVAGTTDMQARTALSCAPKRCQGSATSGSTLGSGPGQVTWNFSWQTIRTRWSERGGQAVVLHHLVIGHTTFRFWRTPHRVAVPLRYVGRSCAPVSGWVMLPKSQNFH